MAEIVKKIGHITKYETTDYVGSAKMIDLDRATSRMAADDKPDGDESLTGEFAAVAPGVPVDDTVPRTPSLGDLGDLATRSGDK